MKRVLCFLLIVVLIFTTMLSVVGCRGSIETESELSEIYLGDY